MRAQTGMIAAICLLAGSASAQRPAPAYSVVTLRSLGGTAAGASSINAAGWISGLSTLPGDTIVHAALWHNGQAVDSARSAAPASTARLRGRITRPGQWWESPRPRLPTRSANVGAAHRSCRPRATPASALPGATARCGRCRRWEGTTATRRAPMAPARSSAGRRRQCTIPPAWAGRCSTSKRCSGTTARHTRSLRCPGIPPPRQPRSTTAARWWAFPAFATRPSALRARGTPSSGRTASPPTSGVWGGVAWNTPAAINQAGQVAGFSDLPGDAPDAPNFHAFLWTRAAGIKDLGTLPGDSLSLAFGINDRGQVVGQSIGDSGSRAFVYQDGAMTDLNALVPAESPVLIYANDINDRGEIVGQAYDPESGDLVAFVAVPR